MTYLCVRKGVIYKIKYTDDNVLQFDKIDIYFILFRSRTYEMEKVAFNWHLL